MTNRNNSNNNNSNNNNNGSLKRKSPPPVNANKKFPTFDGKQTSITDFFTKPTLPQILQPNTPNNNNGLTPIKKTTTTTTTIVESFDENNNNNNLIQQFQNTPTKLPQPTDTTTTSTTTSPTQTDSNFVKTVKTTTTTETFEEFLLSNQTTTTTTSTSTSPKLTRSYKTTHQDDDINNLQITIIDDDNSNSNSSLNKSNSNNSNNNNSNYNRYYLNDFLIVTETVYNRDKHLLVEEEKDYIEGMIETLDRNSQHLFVRLYNRKGPWFEVDSISTMYNNEINNIDQAIESLVEYGFIEFYNSEKDDYNEIATLLKVDQLKSIVGTISSSSSSSSKSSPSKSIYLEILSGKQYKGQTTLLPSQPIYKKKVENLIGNCIRIKQEVTELWRMIHHLYFYSWSTHDSKSMIVNNIMGIKYPNYTVWNSVNNKQQQQDKDKDKDVIDLTDNDKTTTTTTTTTVYDIDLTNNESIFTTRESLLNYEKAKKLEERSYFLYESGGDLVALESILQICLEELGLNVSKKVKYSFALKFTPGWVYTRILSWSIGVLEKLRRYQQCLDYLMLLIESPYCRGKRGFWWQRMIINYKHLQRNDEALLIAERSLKEDPYLRSGDRLAIEKQLIQLAAPPRRWKVPSNLIKFSNKLKEPTSITIYREKISNNQAGYKSKYLFLEPQIKINKIKKVIINSSQDDKKQQLPQLPQQQDEEGKEEEVEQQDNNNNNNNNNSMAIINCSQKSIDSISTTTTINNSQTAVRGSSQSIYIDEETTLEITSDDELYPLDLFPSGQVDNQVNNLKNENEKEKEKQDEEKQEEEQEVINKKQQEEEEEEIEQIIEIVHGSVEEVSLEHYSINGNWNGIHCETSIFITLFVLLFWDIIFDSNVPHVFQSPYQNSPLDFGSDEFYFTRKDAIDNRIRQFEQQQQSNNNNNNNQDNNQDNNNNQYIQSLLNKAWLHNGCEVRGVNWRTTSLEQLTTISKCLGGKLIAFISRLLTEDFKNFSHGMPDLFLWKINDNTSQIKFVEVKGPGDRLRDQQRIWIDMLISFGVDVEVCNVKNKKD